MPDDKTKRRPQDSQRINVNQPYEVNWWRDDLNCTEAQLRAAVAAVGVMDTDVRQYLRSQR